MPSRDELHGMPLTHRFDEIDLKEFAASLTKQPGEK